MEENDELMSVLETLAVKLMEEVSDISKQFGIKLDAMLQFAIGSEEKDTDSLDIVPGDYGTNGN